ncbi:MAG: protein kinase, partial [Silvanigrellaceae bacterium]|nr:protein kinase [Silvanigrellaceae bacterium]
MSASDERYMKRVVKGSSGTVFKAVIPPLAGQEPVEPVAIKIMARTAETEREATIAQLFSGLDHIIPLFSCKMGSNSIELTMPWIPETLLGLMLARKGIPLSLGRASRFFDQMLAATKIMHSRCFVHKDLKLENILHQDGQIFLCDFGFSRSFVRGTTSLCDDLGSLHYAAPELWMAIPYEGPEVDVWALGVCFYLMTTGFFPFPGDNPEEIFHRIELSAKGLQFPKDTCRS